MQPDSNVVSEDLQAFTRTPLKVVRVDNLGEEYSKFQRSFVDGCVHVYDDNGVKRKYIAFHGINPVNGKAFFSNARTCPEGYYIVLFGLDEYTEPEYCVYGPRTFHRLFRTSDESVFTDVPPSVTAVTTSVHFTSYDLRSEEDCAILPVEGTLSVVEYVGLFADGRFPEIHFECDGFSIYVGGTHLWLRECFATLDSERTLFMRHPYTRLLVEIAKVPQFGSPTDALVKMEKLLHDLTAKPAPISTTKEKAL